MKLLIRLCIAICVVLNSHITFAQPPIFYDYAWSDDGLRFIVSVESGVTGRHVTIYDTDWNALASRQLPGATFSFGPDGESFLVNVSGGTIEIWDTDTLQTLRVLPIVGGVIWSPDGTELASFNPSPPGGMKFYNTTNGDLLREFTRSDAPAWSWPYSPLWSPDGAYFAAYLSNQLALLDATTGMQIGTNYQLDGNIYAYSWSSDSTKIALGILKEIPTAVEGSYPTGYESGSHWLNSIVVLEIATGNITTLSSGFRYAGTTLVWSPDDTQITTWLDNNLTILDSASGDVLNSFNMTSISMIIGYSPLGGRLLMGLAENIPFDGNLYGWSQMQSESHSEFRQTALDGLIQIFVPVATLERFAEIAVACDAPSTLTNFDTGITDSAAIVAQAQALLTAINALPEDAITLSCAADLHAIAEAIIAETPALSCDTTITAGDVAALKTAITAANSAGSPQTICLSEGTYTLTSVNHSAGGPNGLPSITGDVTLVGLGSGATIIRDSSVPNFRILRVAGNGWLVLENITISGGNVSGNNGGAIQNAGDLTLDRVTFTNNRARFGGGIHSGGSLTITNSTFSTNSAVENGGAIYVNSGTLTIEDTLFESSSARYGSGVYLHNGTLNLTDVIIRANSATERGAGVYQRTGTLTITGGLFENNAARFGNGVYVDAGSAIISTVVMRDNVAVEEGAAIYNRTGTVSVTDSTFNDNQARYGAAIANRGMISITDSIFTDNSAVENGGALYNTNNNSSNQVEHTCFEGNTARFGGAVFSTTNGFNARDNWWGVGTGPTSVMVNGNVLFTPFLTDGCPN